MQPKFNIPMKKCLTAALLAFTMQAAAQTIHVPGDIPGRATTDESTIICPESATFKLVSTTQDPNGTAYTSYNWEELKTDGTTYGAVENGQPNTTEPFKLELTNAAPGWHTYRVTAAVSTAECPADPVDFTVYVLPKLKVTANANKANDNDLTYCAANGAPTGAKAITFTGSVAFDAPPRSITSKPNYGVSDFEVKYQWYRIDQANAGTRTAVGTNSNTYTLDDAASSPSAPIQYHYELDVTYAVKSCTAANATATHSTGATTAIVTVTPKPGKPVITIQ